MKAAVIVPFPRKVLPPQELKEQISELARRGDVIFHAGVFDNRSGPRSVDIEDARHVLINGIVQHDIRPITSADGYWRCEVIDKDEETSRWLSVSVVVSSFLLFIAAIRWNDE
jgi:hypothetical protein